MKEEFKDAIEKLAGVATVMSHKFDAFHMTFRRHVKAIGRAQVCVDDEADHCGSCSGEDLRRRASTARSWKCSLEKLPNLCAQGIVIQTKIDDVDKHMSRTT